MKTNAIMTPQPPVHNPGAFPALARHATPLFYVLGLLCFALLFHKSRQSCMGSIDLFAAWFITAPVSGLLAMAAFVLAILRCSSVAVRIVGSFAGAIGIVPVCIGVWAVFGPERERFVLLILSSVPTLLALTSLLISHKRPCPAKSSIALSR